MIDSSQFLPHKTKASRAQVFAAADRALQSGGRPTQDGIRRDLGGGSLGSINTYLNEWYRELGSRVATVETPIQGLPVEVSGLLYQLWRLAQNSNKDNNDPSPDQAELRSLDSERSAMQAQNQALEVLNGELRRHRASAERSLAELRALLARREAAHEDECAARQQVEQELARVKIDLEVLKARRAFFVATTPAAVVQRAAKSRRKKTSREKVTAKRALLKRGRKHRARSGVPAARPAALKPVARRHKKR